MIQNQDRVNSLFEELVPGSGKAESLAGELVRATARIAYRFYNDGDQLGMGYGKETCNPAGRFLAAKLPRKTGDLVIDLSHTADENRYEALLDRLAGEVTDYIEANPALRELPTDDMWDYYNPEEDVDDSWDDKDEEW